MNFKRPLSVSLVNGDQKPKQPTKTDVCQVCGDKANFVNYGVLSCSSCKTFFRRNGFNLKPDFVCLLDRNCRITVNTRRSCTACRFVKCLTAGMCPHLIRKEDLGTKDRPTKKSKKEFTSKEIVALPQPRPLNLLSADQSSLTSANWRLFSNVIHAFDTYNCVPYTKEMVRLISISTITSPPNQENSLEIMSSAYIALQAFINCTVDFRVMTTDEQCSLFQRNMGGLLAFYCLFAFRESNVFHNNNTENSILPLYGYDDVQHSKYICAQLDYDPTLIKLMLITLTFSSNIYMITEEQRIPRDSFLYGTFRLFGSQNVYAELLWRYMIYKYDYYEAAQRFDGLVKIVLDALSLSADIYERNNAHQKFADDIAEQTDIALKLNKDEDVPLWGKDHW